MFWMDISKNNEERLAFVDKWAEYVRNNSDEDWSRQQNILINSGLISSNISKEEYLEIKKES